MDDAGQRFQNGSIASGPVRFGSLLPSGHTATSEKKNIERAYEHIFFHVQKAALNAHVVSYESLVHYLAAICQQL